MSNNELNGAENVEDYADDLDDVNEFKASMGDESELPDAKTKKTTEKPRGPKEPMKKAEDASGSKVSAPATKAGLINAMVKSMGGMKKEDLASVYSSMMGDLEEDQDYDDDEDVHMISRFERITANDIDIEDDVAAIMNGLEIDEENQERIRTVFEAAVVTTINDLIENLAVEVEFDVENTKVLAIEELSDRLDNYLDYVVTEWVEDNQLAIQHGVRAEMVEEFLGGLHTLFTEHYIDIPEEKVDVVEELMARVDELENILSEATDKNVELMSTNKTFRKEIAFYESVEDLTDTQVEKLHSLSESIDFVDEDDYSDKLSMLKKQYFDIDEETESVVEYDFDSPLDDINEDVGYNNGYVTPEVSAYAAAMSKNAKRAI